MKSILLAFLLIFSGQSFGQKVFSVSPGLSFNSAHFGFKSGKMVPFLGIQYLRGALDFENHSTYTSSYSSDIDDSEGSASLNLFIPTLGLKLYLSDANKVSTYALICLSKPIILASTESNGKEEDDYLDDVGLWGGELGFGAEYNFDENFSIGGEFGIRYIGINYEHSSSSSDEYSSETNQEKLSLSLSPTYSKITLNYTF